MLEKIKKTFQNRTSRNGSYSVGLIALVVGIVVAVNLQDRHQRQQDL